MVRAHDSSRLWGAFAALVFVSAAWGANVPVSKYLLGHFDLVPLTAVRNAVALVALATLLAIVEGVRSLRIDVGVVRFLLLGLLMGSFVLIYMLGIRLSNPISAALIQIAAPIVTAVTVRLMVGTRLDPGFGAALLLTMIGGMVWGWGSLQGRDLTFEGGEPIVLGAHVVWTVYTIKNQQWFAIHVSQLHRSYVATASVVLWSVLLSAILIRLGVSVSPFHVTGPEVWAQLLAISVVATGLAGYFWNVGASRVGIAAAALWNNVVPLFAVLWSMAYGFYPAVEQILGGLIAMIGVGYMQWRQLRRTSSI